MPSKSDSSYSEGSLLQHRENNSRTSLSSDGIISVETMSTASGLSVDETLKKRDLTPIKELGAGQFAKFVSSFGIWINLNDFVFSLEFIWQTNKECQNKWPSKCLTW